MSPNEVLDALTKQGILSAGQRDMLAESEQKKPFSIHWELRVLLYIGVLLLSAGLGLLVYDHFDQIGHDALLVGIATACVASFAFAWRYRPEWALSKVKSHSTLDDYALLLSCLLFLTLEGYAQYAYHAFGNRYGLVTLLPALLFLPLSYRFDHRAVLGMALTALISWVGVTVKPLTLYFKTNFFDQRTVFSAIGLALVLITVASLLERRRIKPHFTYTYLAIASNLLLVALLGGLFNFDSLRVGFALGIALTCFALDRYARQTRSFLFLLMSIVYGYIAITYLFFHYLTFSDDSVYYWYFILTGTVFVYYLMSQLPKRTP